MQLIKTSRQWRQQFVSRCIVYQITRPAEREILLRNSVNSVKFCYTASEAYVAWRHESENKIFPLKPLNVQYSTEGFMKAGLHYFDTRSSRTLRWKWLQSARTIRIHEPENVSLNAYNARSYLIRGICSCVGVCDVIYGEKHYNLEYFVYKSFNQFKSFFVQSIQIWCYFGMLVYLNLGNREIHNLVILLYLQAIRFVCPLGAFQITTFLNYLFTMLQHLPFRNMIQYFFFYCAWTK